MNNQMPTRRHQPRRLLLGGGIAAAVALAVGIGAIANDTPTPASTSSALTTIAGDSVRLPAGKPAAMFFFSVSCGACVEGARSLGEAATAADRAGLVADFVAIDLDPRETAETVAGFLAYVDAADVPAVIDGGAELAQRFKVASLSTLIVVNADGEVTFRGTDSDAATITAELEKAGA
jgi:thiol-disulfide isomerase/thioredoxin